MVKLTEQQEITRKSKLSIDARKLNNLKDKARPIDMGLFHADIEIFFTTQLLKQSLLT
jgi:hypothetical protein